MRTVARSTRTARRPVRLAAALGCALTVASLSACGGDDEPTSLPSSDGPSTLPTTSVSSAPTSAPPATTPPPPSGEVTGRVAPPEVVGDVATGLDAPWSIAFLPGGDALVSQRDAATIVRVTDGGEVTDVGPVPGVAPGGEGGLLGLAVSPDFATDQFVYAYFTSASDNRIVRMPYDGTSLGEPELVTDGILRAGNHNGGRIIFGPDGMLYAGTGDAGDPDASQDTGSLNGKILRMTPDGGVPPDNPFGNLVWSYGHRNVQGLGFGEDGRLWASEFGQNTWDELNLIERGANYGWPVAEGQVGVEGMTDPVEQWATDDASPSGIAVAGNQVYMAALKGARLWHIPAPGAQTSLEPVAYFTGEYGRLRDVVAAPDGSLWVLTNNTDGRGSPRDGDDRILRVDRTLG